MTLLDNAYALVIGISNYQYINKLPSIILKDAQDIYNLLIDPYYCGYPLNNVELLLDGEANLKALHKSLTDLSNRSNKNSTIFFYFSGHGACLESGPHAGEYLLPVDTEFLSAQSIAQTAISGVQFTKILQTISARKVVVVFDCCHAGGIGQPKDPSALIIKPGLPESYYDKLKAGQGRAILASSRSTESSWILPGAKNSLFTQYLLAGLQGGIPSEDGLIRIFDLFEYLQPRVTGDEPNQHPVFKADLEENFPVSLHLGGQRGVVTRDEQGFCYDAYISYVSGEPDSSWVWKKLIPYLKKAGLRIAVSGFSEDPGVATVVGVERAIEQSKRTVLILSEAYLTDNLAHFQNVLAQTIGIWEGKARILPVVIEQIDKSQLRSGLGMLSMLDLTDPYLSVENFSRLAQILRGPLPRG